MSKFKTFFILASILIFSFLLIGCGLLASRETGTAEEAVGGELPEWLLLSYRTDNNTIIDKETVSAEGDEKEERTAENVSQTTTLTQQPTPASTATTAPAAAAPAPAAPTPAPPTALTEREKLMQSWEDAFYQNLLETTRVQGGYTDEQWNKIVDKKLSDGEEDEGGIHDTLVKRDPFSD